MVPEIPKGKGSIPDSRESGPGLRETRDRGDRAQEGLGQSWAERGHWTQETGAMGGGVVHNHPRSPTVTPGLSRGGAAAARGAWEPRQYAG